MYVFAGGWLLYASRPHHNVAARREFGHAMLWLATVLFGREIYCLPAMLPHVARAAALHYIAWCLSYANVWMFRWLPKCISLVHIASSRLSSLLTCLTVLARKEKCHHSCSRVYFVNSNLRMQSRNMEVGVERNTDRIIAWTATWLPWAGFLLYNILHFFCSLNVIVTEQNEKYSKNALKFYERREKCCYMHVEN